MGRYLNPAKIIYDYVYVGVSNENLQCANIVVVYHRTHNEVVLALVLVLETIGFDSVVESRFSILLKLYRL